MNPYVTLTLGGLLVLLAVAVIVLYSQREMLNKFNLALGAKNAELNQQIVAYQNMAQVYAQREQDFMKKPMIATIRPEEAKTMAKIIADAMQGKTPLVD